MVSTRHTPGKGYTEEALSLSRMIEDDCNSSDPYDYMQAARKEKEKTDSIVGNIVVFVTVVVIAFSLGHLIGSCAMQEDFRENICRDMPTTADYFSCRAARDFYGSYKLVKR